MTDGPRRRREVAVAIQRWAVTGASVFTGAGAVLQLRDHGPIGVIGVLFVITTVLAVWAWVARVRG
jgi:hypothetical protein